MEFSYNKVVSNMHLIENKQFEPYISKEELNEITTNIAANVNECYKNCSKPPILIGSFKWLFYFSCRFS